MEITCLDPIAYDVPYSISVNACDQFEAHCHDLYFTLRLETRVEFDEFMNFKRNEFEVKTDCDGFIHLTRQVTGGVTLNYDLKDSKIDDICKICGRINIDGEFSSSVLKDLRKTIFSKMAE